MLMSRVLILGATGMLGHTLITELDQTKGIEVHGTARDKNHAFVNLPAKLIQRVTPKVDALNFDSVRRVLRDVHPDLVVNCIGVIKQDPTIQDAIRTISANSLFPRALAQECASRDARLIHISTDCVFSGARGNYSETDNPDPVDLYGRSKLLGEITEAPALTLRMSLIGHELGTSRSLVDWFLSQSGTVKGFTRAIYSGVTTTEFARLLVSNIFPRNDLTGLFHVASSHISKYDLLRLIAQIYRWPGEILPVDDFVCDRSLSADALFSVTGYRPPTWPEMIIEMNRVASNSRLLVRGSV